MRSANVMAAELAFILMGPARLQLSFSRSSRLWSVQMRSTIARSRDWGIGLTQTPAHHAGLTRKANSALSRNPSNPLHQIESFIRFLGDGTIESPDATLNGELNDVLNLNLDWQKENRKAVLDGFLKAISKHQGAFTREILLRWIAQWNGGNGGVREPYCHVVVFWLRKKLDRMTP